MHQPRRPAGTPIGGQFAPVHRPDAIGLELVDDDFFEPADEPANQPESPLVDPAERLQEDAEPGPDDNAPDPLLARAFGVDAGILERARVLVQHGIAEREHRLIDPATWSAAEAAVTEAGHHLASVIDLLVRQRHPDGFPVDLARRFDETSGELAASREATLEVLGAIRSLGLPAGEQVKVVDSQKPAAALLDEVSQRFPADWLAASQAKDPPLRARVSPHRAHYSPSRTYSVDEGTQLREVRYTVHDARYVPEGVEAEQTSLGYWTWTATEPRRVRGHRHSADLTVPSPKTRPAEARATATHELTHRIEDANRQLGYLEDAFLRRRCRDEDGQLRPARPIAHMRSERARDGGFVTPYVGKVYPTMTFHEVLSTGTEAVFSGSYGGLVGRFGEKMDPDHRAFVLGCLALA